MQYSLYIRKSVNEDFKGEPDKSKLVNELLIKHYRAGPVRVNVKENTDGTISPRRVGTPFEYQAKPVVIENLGTGKVEEIAPAHVQEEQGEPEEEDDKAWIQEEYVWNNQNKWAVNKETGETARAKLVNGKIILL